MLPRGPAYGEILGATFATPGGLCSAEKRGTSFFFARQRQREVSVRRRFLFENDEKAAGWRADRGKRCTGGGGPKAPTMWLEAFGMSGAWVSHTSLFSAGEIGENSGFASLRNPDLAGPGACCSRAKGPDPATPPGRRAEGTDEDCRRLVRRSFLSAAAGRRPRERTRDFSTGPPSRLHAAKRLP